MKHNHLFLYTLLTITFIFMGLLLCKSNLIEGHGGGIGHWGGIGSGRGYGYGYLGSGYYGINPLYMYGVEQYPYPYLYYNSYY